jgi:hypothetical protein
LDNYDEDDDEYNDDDDYDNDDNDDDHGDNKDDDTDDNVDYGNDNLFKQFSWDELATIFSNNPQGKETKPLVSKRRVLFVGCCRESSFIFLSLDTR